MSFQFLTCMFIILVSVQLSCGWSLWRSDEKKEMSTAKSSKDDETNSPPTAKMLLDCEGPLLKCANDYKSGSAESSVIESVNSRFIFPKVTYAPKDKDVSSWIDEEKGPTLIDQQIERKVKEILSPRNTSTAMKNTPTTTGDTLNPTSNVNVARNATTDTESYYDKKPGALVGSGSNGSFFGNFTLNFCIFLGDLLFLIHHLRGNTSF